MSFYDDASLVLIPSAQKTSKVYSVKPTDGSGDLTFTRASTATRVNSSGLIEAVASNVPRLDYLGSTCPRLLLEPQRTNLLTYSEQFNNAAYTKTNLTITANTTASPDGTTNADTAATTSSVSELYNGSSTALTTATCSLFVKKSTHKYFGISINGTNNFDSRYQGVFDLDLGTVFQENNSPTPLTNCSSKIESYGNGWYRISVTATFATSANGFVVFQQSNNVPSIPSDNLAWNNSSIGSTFIWGAQMEAGAYATSYIPTLAASATRGADAASKTGISSLIGQTEGTLFLDFDFVSGVNANYGIIYQAAFTTYIYINQQTTGSITGQVQGVGGFAFTVAKPNGRYKCALAYKSGNSAFFVNGVQVGTTNTTTFTPTTIDIFSLQVGTETNTNNQALLFKTRLTNAQLAELTTL
jgi:hypothetical protein